MATSPIDKTIVSYAVIGIILLILINKLIGRIIPKAWWEKRPEQVEEEAREAVREARISEVFDPEFATGTEPYGVLPLSYLNTLAKKINDSWGTWNDDEATIFDVMHNKIKTLSQVAQLAGAYSRLYNKSLLMTFRQNLSGHEFDLLWDGIKNKPVGK